MAKVKNVYDMAGNVWEWTMEGKTDIYHSMRGGYFKNNGKTNPPAYRIRFETNKTYFGCGARVAIYIKL